MSIYKHDLIRWLNTLPEDAHVGIDEGGLTLECVEDVQAYMEVGGMPEDDDEDDDEGIFEAGPDTHATSGRAIE